MELLLHEFRKRNGYKRVPSHGADRLQISEEAQYEAFRVQSHFPKPGVSTEWVTPQQIFELVADTTEYDPMVEYEQQRRAGLLLNPVYTPPNPPPTMGIVRDYASEREQMEAQQRQQEFQPSPEEGQTQASSNTQSAAPSPTQAKEKKSSGQIVPLIEEDEEFDDMEMSDEHERGGDEADVIYGSGRITYASMTEFVNHNPDSALKFLAQRELDGKHLPPPVLGVYEAWNERGLSRGRVKKYIMELMEWDKLPEMPLADMWAALRDRIYDLTHGLDVYKEE